MFRKNIVAIIILLLILSLFGMISAKKFFTKENFNKSTIIINEPCNMYGFLIGKDETEFFITQKNNIKKEEIEMKSAFNPEYKIQSMVEQVEEIEINESDDDYKKATESSKVYIENELDIVKESNDTIISEQEQNITQNEQSKENNLNENIEKSEHIDEVEEIIEIFEDVDNQEIEENNIEENNEEELATQNIVESGVASTYEGYSTVGKIEIPKTGVNMPILSEQSVKGMQIAPCQLCSTGKLNEDGITLITGHNYRNGKLFSNNDKLQNGDKVIITTINGNRVEYTVYDKIVTNPEDIEFLFKDTNGNPEIILSSCSDDEENRVVIFAK